jgi:hypothetical protein
VWVTTRDPRAGESDGVDYHFVEDFAFQVMKEQDRFLVSYEVRRLTGSLVGILRNQSTGSRFPLTRSIGHWLPLSLFHVLLPLTW